MYGSKHHPEYKETGLKYLEATLLDDNYISLGYPLERVVSGLDYDLYYKSKKEIICLLSFFLFIFESI